MNINKDLKEQIARSAKKSGFTRDEILDRMNDLAERYGVRLMKGNAKALTMTTFEKWLNPQAIEHMPSPNALIVFCCAIEDLSVMKVMLSPLGAQVIDEKDIKLLLWAKEYRRAKDAQTKMKKLERELREKI